VKQWNSVSWYSILCDWSNLWRHQLLC